MELPADWLSEITSQGQRSGEEATLLHVPAPNTYPIHIHNTHARTHVHTHTHTHTHTHRVHAVTMHKSADRLHAAMDSHLQELGVEGVASRDLVDIIEGYSIGKSTKEERGEQVGGYFGVRDNTVW